MGPDGASGPIGCRQMQQAVRECTDRPSRQIIVVYYRPADAARARRRGDRMKTREFIAGHGSAVACCSVRQQCAAGEWGRPCQFVQ
jgi:hypothetical protein